MVNIRIAKKSDAIGIAKVHLDTRRSTYSGLVPDEYLNKRSYDFVATKWVKRITDPESSEFIFVAEENDKIIGFTSAGTTFADEGYDCILSTIYILKEYQRKGIGKQLLRYVVEMLIANNIKNLIVWVYAENDNRKFYEYLGGEYVKEKVVNQGKELLEVAYCWNDLKKLFISL